MNPKNKRSFSKLYTLMRDLLAKEEHKRPSVIAERLKVTTDGIIVLTNKFV